MRILLTILIIAVMAMPALAERDMTGSYVEIIGPDVANPGDTVTFEFNVCNGSPDAEWTTEVRFTFAETINVLDGWYDDGGLGWVFDFSTSGDFDETAHFLDGDEYGDHPHWIGGDLPFVLCVTPVEESTFSSVKSLY